MAKTAWLLCLCMLLAPGSLARAQTYALSADPSADVLTLTFPQKAPVPSTLRTGPRQVEMLFPAGTKLAPVPAQPGRGRHVLGLGVADNVLVVQVAQESFGFVVSPKGANVLQLQVFYDPAGARWQPRGPAPTDAGQDQTQPPTQAPAQPQAQAQAQTGAGVQPGTQPAPGPAAQNVPPPASPGESSRIVRHSVDLSAAPPADQAQASAAPPDAAGPRPASQSQPPASQSQPPASQSQGAEPVSGPARSLLAQAQAPAPDAARATSGPGAIEQRLRQAAPTVPAGQTAAPAGQASLPTPAGQGGQTPGAQAPGGQTPGGQTATPAAPQAAPQAVGSPATSQAPAATGQTQPSGAQGRAVQAQPQAVAGQGAQPSGAPATPMTSQASSASAPQAPQPAPAGQGGQAPGAQTATPAAPQAVGSPAISQAPAATGQTQPSGAQGRAVQAQPQAVAGQGAQPSSAPATPMTGQASSASAPQAPQPAPAGQGAQAPGAQTATSAPAGQGAQAPAGTNAPDSGPGPQDQAQAAQPPKPQAGVRGSVSGAAPQTPDTGQAPSAQTQSQPQGQGQAQGQPSAPPAQAKPGVRGQLSKDQTPPPTAGTPPAGPATSGQTPSGQADTGAKPVSAPAGAQTPAPAGAPQDQSAAPAPESPPATPFSPQDGPSVDLTAPPKKSAPAQPKPEAFTLPAPGQEHPGTDTVEDKAFFVTGEQAASRGDFDKAESIFRTVLANPAVSPYLRENALYSLADLLFDKNREHITDAYQLIDNAYQEALNFNTTSRNIPKALVNLGYLNLRMGNLPEARAYFTLLKTKYPLDENVPLIDVYWGQHYLGQSKLGDQQGNLTRAAQAFRSVLQNAPESKFAKDAALGLATALLDLKQYDEAAKVLDYVDKRWPRYYVENPSLRRVTADVAYKLGNYEKAKDEYLWFMNLVPADDTMDIVLARLGDVYARLDKRPVAREFYEMAVKRYPGKEGALMSLMRLAEQGVHDSPTTQEMFKAFASPKDVQPDEIYQMLVRDYPKSSVAPLALLKLSMWRLYQKQYPESLDSVLQFTNQYPGDELEKQAVEVGGQAFLKMLPTLMEDNNYKRVIDLWRKYPFLAKNLDFLPKRERLALALAQYYTGFPREALEAALPFLDQGPSEDSQKALALVLTIYRENQDWKAVLDTLRKVSGWKLKDNPRRILEFAQAMALEHTGDFAKSRLLWGRLAMDQQLDPAKRAYAVYYQARTAMERGDNEKAANWGMEARTLFEEAAKDTGKAQDALQLVIEAMQAGGRFQEALALCGDYAKTVKEGSPEWAANRFRMAKLYGALGDRTNWRKILEEMRDTLGDSLYAKMAASELATSTLEERAGKLSSPK